MWLLIIDLFFKNNLLNTINADRFYALLKILNDWKEKQT